MSEFTEEIEMAQRVEAAFERVHQERPGTCQTCMVIGWNEAQIALASYHLEQPDNDHRDQVAALLNALVANRSLYADHK